MHLELTDEQKVLQQTVREFANSEVKPLAKEIDETGRFPRETFRYLWYWQMFSGGAGYPWWGRTYTIGLEPFTSYPNLGLEEAIRNGSALKLGAGETLRAEILATAFSSHQGVASVSSTGEVKPLDL